MWLLPAEKSKRLNQLMYVVSIDAQSKTELILLGRHPTIPHVKAARALRRFFGEMKGGVCDKCLKLCDRYAAETGHMWDQSMRG